MPDETCSFLAIDLDKSCWEDDARSLLAVCSTEGVPAGLERSRSGRGAHVWIFFREPVPARTARALGSGLLTRAMESRPEIGLTSYDRLFPNQDLLPQGGFGSLIALPLQGRSRANGNTVFVDSELQPYPDQFAFLSSLRRLDRGEVERLVERAEAAGQVLGVRTTGVEDTDDEPWLGVTSRRPRTLVTPESLPAEVELVLAKQIYLEKGALPPALINLVIRLAAFQNPEFHRAQGLRLSTFGKPRVIGCAEDYPKHVGLPRGCLDEVVELLSSLGIAVSLRDERASGSTLVTEFLGTLRDDQEEAARALLEHDTGVLAAGTAFGKTVVAAHLVAARSVSTLVLVHRQQLLEQWAARLGTFLDLPRGSIGTIGAGKRRATGVIDIALLQTLGRDGSLADLTRAYGHLVVDECHHLPATSFERVARAFGARYVLGLSATTIRKDGHHPIVFMQCGPVRFRVTGRQAAESRPFVHRVVVRPTGFRLAPTATPNPREPSLAPTAPAGPSIQDIYRSLSADTVRNELITQDVLAAVRAGRSPLVLTERKEHLQTLAEALLPHVPHVVVLHGGLGRKQSRAAAERLRDIPESERRVIVATGRFLGEGFDDARLDTLFLALPISWRGTLAQYAGRLHRAHAGKTEVIVYDYADLDVPMLARMHQKRLHGYWAMGYEVESGERTPAQGRTTQVRLPLG